MSNALSHVTIQGFKSIQTLDEFELSTLNIIVGANGAGKSNFIAFFKLLNAMMSNTLNRYVRDQGGASDLLFQGPKITQRIHISMKFGEHGYRFDLVATPNNQMDIEDEARYYSGSQAGWCHLGDGHQGHSSMVAEAKSDAPDSQYSKPVYQAISAWTVYHFHDTSRTATMRGYEITQDRHTLRHDASNIAPFLLKLKNEHPLEYQEIISAIQLVIPFFKDFELTPRHSGPKQEVNLSWVQQGSDYPMQPYHFSDGSIRFICLATALLQPTPPATMIIDEPELGLHPSAIAILAELIQAASERTQLIIATQSAELINYFSIEDIVVAKRERGASVLNRLKVDDYSQWLEEYSIGELWKKNVIQGGPTHE